MFRWKSLGFTIKHECPGVEVDINSFSEVISEELLEKHLSLGTYFYHPVHHITVGSMTDYEKYVVRGE